MSEPVNNPFAEPQLLQTADSATACSVCGRQDETVRAVMFPFVFSVIVLTFRRAFSGTWCAKHRRQYQSLATLITAGVGWFGIPFGFIYTPGSLFKLVRGGVQPAEINAKLLISIANHKLRQNDPRGALKCFEESLKFREDETALSNIKLIRETTLAGKTEEKKRDGRTYLGMLFVSFLVGIVIGFLDLFITSLLDPLLANTESLLLILFSWIPFLALVTMGAVLLANTIRRFLTRISQPKKGRFTFLALLAGFFAFYGIMHGSAIADNIYYYLIGGPIESVGYEIIVNILTLLIGGLSWLLYSLEVQYAYDAIYLVLLGLVLIFYLITARTAGVNTFHWRDLVIRSRQRLD